MGASFSLRGASEMRRRMEAMTREVPERAGKALHEEGESVLAASQAIVPVETGALKETGRVTEVEIGDGEIAVAVTYGDETVLYAAAVHESESPGAKYLERPLRDAVGGMARRLADRIKV